MACDRQRRLARQISDQEAIMPMKNPPHPGRIVRQDCLEPLELTIAEAAEALGVTRRALNNLVNGKSGISPEMAVRPSKAFGTSPEMWLRLQVNYDLAQLHQDELNVKRYRRSARGTPPVATAGPAPECEAGL
jgi:addiction module HigA family antidote